MTSHPFNLWRLKWFFKFVFLVQLFALFLPNGVFAAPQTPAKYSFKEDELFNGLSADLTTLIVYDTVPEKIHRGAALNLYALLFQLWLVKGKQTDPFLSKSYVNFIMRQVKPYVNLDDPMDLLRFYEGNTLNNLGLTKANLEPLRNADQIFQNEDAYLHLVAEFSNWRNGLAK
jgi:hypothetical protein